MINSLKQKKCKICGNEFIPSFSSFQKTCFKISCCLAQGKLDKERNLPRIESARRIIERKALSESREKAKTRQMWIKEAQQAFNAYIRERDYDQPCISCQRKHPGQYHAGHFRTTKAAPELRFYEDNVHKQCSVCNNHLSGNLLGYRIGLIEKIGEDRLAWLEGPHEPAKWTIEQLKEIKATYKQKLKELRKSHV